MSLCLSFTVGTLTAGNSREETPPHLHVFHVKVQTISYKLFKRRTTLHRPLYSIYIGLNFKNIQEILQTGYCTVQYIYIQ
jgi:hypothetical protein